MYIVCTYFVVKVWVNPWLIQKMQQLRIVTVSFT